MVPSGTVLRLAILIHLNKSKTASVNNLIQCPLEGFGPFLPFSPCLCGGEHIFACKGAPVSTSGLWGGETIVLISGCGSHIASRLTVTLIVVGQSTIINSALLNHGEHAECRLQLVHIYFALEATMKGRGTC